MSKFVKVQTKLPRCGADQAGAGRSQAHVCRERTVHPSLEQFLRADAAGRKAGCIFCPPRRRRRRLRSGRRRHANGRIRGTLQKVQQRYAYHKVLTEVESAGFRPGRRECRARQRDPHDCPPLELTMYMLDLMQRADKELVQAGARAPFGATSARLTRHLCAGCGGPLSTPIRAEQFGVILTGDLELTVGGETMLLRPATCTWCRAAWRTAPKPARKVSPRRRCLARCGTI